MKRKWPPENVHISAMAENRTCDYCGAPDARHDVWDDEAGAAVSLCADCAADVRYGARRGEAEQADR